MATRDTKNGPSKLVAMRPDSTARPIIDNPRLKMMPETPAPSQRIRGEARLMAGDEERVQPPPGPIMEPVPERAEAAAGRAGEEQVETPREPDQETHPASVRLRLRVSSGDISIIGVHVVPGTVAFPNRLDYGLAYEIADGGQLVAAGSVPDVGERRSYPDPQGRPGLEGHHIEELETFEINVRLPRQALTAASLPRLAVSLFRMKEQPVAAPDRTRSLIKQFGNQLRPIAEMRGIRPKDLPERVQEQLKAAMAPSPARPLRR